MNRKSHIMFGASCGACVSVVAGCSLWQTVVSAGVAATTAPLPDLDQRSWWRTLDRWIPDEWLGHGGPLAHRGITHWWGIQVLLMFAVHSMSTGDCSWVLYVGCIGLCSHLIGDFILGAKSRYRGPGIPLMPWWRHVGLGVRCGGFCESAVVLSSCVGVCCVLLSY